MQPQAHLGMIVLIHHFLIQQHIHFQINLYVCFRLYIIPHTKYILTYKIYVTNIPDVSQVIIRLGSLLVLKSLSMNVLVSDAINAIQII